MKHLAGLESVVRDSRVLDNDMDVEDNVEDDLEDDLSNSLTGFNKDGDRF